MTKLYNFFELKFNLPNSDGFCLSDGIVTDFVRH